MCKALHYGLNIPGQWYAWNSWYVIKYWPGRYIRWTNHWFGWFSPSHRRWMKQMAAIIAENKVKRGQFQKILLSNDDVNGLIKDFSQHHENFKDVSSARLFEEAGMLQKSHGESLEDAGYQHCGRIQPNALTQETLEKTERGEDMSEPFDTVKELFEDLDN